MYRAGQEEINEVSEVLRSKKWFSRSPSDGHLREAIRFEDEWAEMVGTDYALLMCGGGTAGLTCAMAGLGIGPGDEVIVPAYTWMATATSVLSAGAIPVLAEVDETLALDPADFERKITPNVKAVLPVHMLGRAADLEPILAIAREHDIKVIEDSCQMDGGSYHGRRTGSWGDAGVFSFNWFKIISAGGEGGCLVTSDRTLYERAVIFHDSGSAFRPQAGELTEPIFVAQQYRTDEVSAAIARVQLQRLEGILADLRRNARGLEQRLTDGGLTIAPNNDIEGDCGICVALRFESEQQTRRFAEAAGVSGYCGLDHGKHVFTEWTPLQEKRVMHHPAMNPFHFEQNKGLRMQYDASVCPKTLDWLGRTFFLATGPDLTDAQLDEIASKCIDGIQALVG